jgi:hypothetical protein
VYCATVLRPDLDEAGKRKLANAILSLGDNQDRTLPKRRITPAAVEEMSTENASLSHWIRIKALRVRRNIISLLCNA